MNTTASLLEQLIACGTPAHLVAEVARLEAELTVWKELSMEEIKALIGGNSGKEEER